MIDVFCCHFSRQNPMGLIAGLDDTGNATGFLFWDDGDSQGINPAYGRLHYIYI